MKRFANVFEPAAAFLLFSCLALGGCSSSSDSHEMSEDDNMGSGIDSNASAEQEEEIDTSSDIDANNTGEESSAGDVGEVDEVDETGDAIVADDAIDPPGNGESLDVPDPMVQNNTDVTFEVTVPAYQSNELQLHLSWGDFSASLSWIGDEFWSTSVVLPTETEHQLSIVFFDENGDIELGSFEQQYKTGINAAEVFKITADQFDTTRWDFDGDGINNLDELIAGTDPRVDEKSLLPIVDTQQMSLLFIANYFEALLPTERPYTGTQEDFIPEGPVRGAITPVTVVTTAKIDSNGSGSIAHGYEPNRLAYNLIGDRLVQEDSVQWSGYWTYLDDYSLRQIFNSEVSVNGDNRRLVEQGSGSWVGTYTHSWETTIDVTGQPIEGSDFCKVASGTITETFFSYQNFLNAEDRSTTRLTITRESADDLWYVSMEKEVDGESSSSEYYARELSMHMIRFFYQYLVSENDYFFCNFVDLR